MKHVLECKKSSNFVTLLKEEIAPCTRIDGYDFCLSDSLDASKVNGNEKYVCFSQLLFLYRH